MKTNGLKAIALVAVALLVSGCNNKKVSISTTDDNQPRQEKPIYTDDKTEDPVIIIDDNIEITDRTDNSLTTTSKLSTVHFAFDKSDLDDENYQKAVHNVELIKDYSDDVEIRIEGHCDEWGRDEYNLALGLRRAHSVKKLMIAEGIQENRISLVSYGEMNPVCNDKSSVCSAKNRRVEFIKLNEQTAK